MLEIASCTPDKIDDLIELGQRDHIKSTAILLDTSVLGIAVLNQNGEMISCTEEFGADGSEKYIDPEFAQQSLLRARGLFDPATSMVYIPTTMLDVWAWPQAITQAVRAPDAVAVFTERLNQPGAIRKACFALGLRNVHHKVIEATIDQGTIKAAAHQLDISHQRARAIIAEALAATQCSTIQELVSTIAAQAFGVIPKDNASVDELLRDIWGVTERQASLAILISEGHTRAAAAQFLGLSQAVVKKEMSALYQGLGINSAPELATRLAAARLFAYLKLSSKITGEIGDFSMEPLEIMFASDGRRIAFSDYGPKDGFPVFFIHSSMTSRFVPLSIRRALMHRGFRIISIDRPGFGLTSKAHWNQFEQAAKDFCLVQDHIGAKSALALSRGGAQFLLALARHRPDALVGAVVVNPDPATIASDKRMGPLGAVKEYFLRSPFMISTFATITAKALNPERVRYWLRKSLASSSSDLKAAMSTEVANDYWRSVRGFSIGQLDGYIAEQIELAVSADHILNKPQWPWTFVIGAQDVLHDPNATADYWQNLVSESELIFVEDGGRLLAFTHAPFIADALLNLRDRKMGCTENSI